MQNRVAMRFLCGHYLALSSPPRKGFVGLVQQGVSLTSIAQVAAMEAASICCHALGACPEIRMKVDRSGDGLVATVPEYVHYVVLELLKNAMRATMKAHGGKDGVAAQRVDASAKNSSLQERAGGAKGGAGDSAGGGKAPIVFADVPEVTISVTTEGEDDIVLVVSDQGEGIPAEATDKVRRTAACVVVVEGVDQRWKPSLQRRSCTSDWSCTKPGEEARTSYAGYVNCAIYSSNCWSIVTVCAPLLPERTVQAV